MAATLLGEVFVDNDGNWMDGSAGDGPFGPFGWSRCLGACSGCPGGLLRWFNTPPCCCQNGVKDAYLPVAFHWGMEELYTVQDSAAPAAWSAVTDYARGDLVTYAGVVYYAIWQFHLAGFNVNKQPDVNPYYWQPMDLPATTDSVATMVARMPGSSGAGFGWAGPQTETADAWVQQGALTGDPGWHPQNGECWKFSCWHKGLDCGVGSGLVQTTQGDPQPSDEATIAFTVCVPGFGASAPFTASTIIWGDWVYYEHSFTWVAGDTGPGHTIPWIYPVIEFFGSQFNYPISVTEPYFTGHLITHTVHEQNGTIAIRDPHLALCEQTSGNWIDNFHGHG